MKISTIAFDCMYKNLTASFYHYELTEKQQKKYKVNDYNIWEEEETGQDGKNFFVRIFGDFRISRDHFWRKIGHYKKLGAQEVPIKDELLITIFEYLDVKIPKEIAKENKNTEAKQAAILYEQFLKDTNLGYLKNKLDVETMAYQSILDGDYTDDLEVTLKKLVKGYYENISKKNYEMAWIAFGKSIIAKRWSGNIENFAKSFINTVALKNITVFDLNIGEEKFAQCKVYYEEILLIHTSSDLERLKSSRVSDVDDFREIINNILQVALELGKSSFKRTLIADLLGANFNRTIYRPESPSENLKPIFPEDQTKKINRLEQITLAFINDKWMFWNMHSISTDHLYEP